MFGMAAITFAHILVINVLLWPPLRSNGQAIIFYLCDLVLFIIICYLFFRALIFEAEERRPAGPLPRCRNVV